MPGSVVSMGIHMITTTIIMNTIMITIIMPMSKITVMPITTTARFAGPFSLILTE